MLPKVMIQCMNDNQTVCFAANELAKYAAGLSNSEVDFIVTHEASKPDYVKNCIQLGLFKDFSMTEEVENSAFDDEIYINIKQGSGIICGSNYRSVLIGTYRFLTEAGIRWVRPGKDGEIIPGKDITAIDVSLREKASYRYRGICIEGAVSYENVADIIEWAPKIGFNSYFIQFKEAFTFFDRWYNPPYKEAKDNFNIDKAREYVRCIQNEIKKRGLILQSVGHGWTCDALGLPALGWETCNDDLSEEKASYIAMVNGKRALWNKIPMNTNLCYSNTDVQRLILAELLKYIEKHPEAEMVHFWLADDFNNQCECTECQKMRPTDFYVKMLNNLDEILTQKELKTKIVFLIYFDLLWTPEFEHLRNKDRFILMFAPITRTYSESFPDRYDNTAVMHYKRNNIIFPSSVPENLAFLREWKNEFQGDSFDFDYHLMWDHYLDCGHMNISRIIWQDVRNLKALGLNGLVSCQVQRVFLPTGLAMYTMGKTLWNASLNFDGIVKEYFEAAFGEDWPLCRTYLEKLSNLFNIEFMKGKKIIKKTGIVKTAKNVMTVIREFRNTIIKNASAEKLSIARSWQILKYHADIYYLLALAIHENTISCSEAALQIWDALVRFVQKKEDKFQATLDVFEFCNVINNVRSVFSEKGFNFTRLQVYLGEMDLHFS